MSDRQETIEILVIKQDDKPIRKTIPNTLEAKQHEVGGYIEPYGLKNGATIYCNEEGKLGSWSLNRAIRAYDLDNRAGSQIVEMMAGTFFISGFDPESGEDTEADTEPPVNTNHIEDDEQQEDGKQAACKEVQILYLQAVKLHATSDSFVDIVFHNRLYYRKKERRTVAATIRKTQAPNQEPAVFPVSGSPDENLE